MPSCSELTVFAGVSSEQHSFRLYFASREFRHYLATSWSTKNHSSGRGVAIVAGNSVSNDYPRSDCGTSSLLLATHDADSAVWEVARAKVISHFNVISPCFAKAKQGASLCDGHDAKFFEKTEPLLTLSWTPLAPAGLGVIVR